MQRILILVAVFVAACGSGAPEAPDAAAPDAATPDAATPDASPPTGDLERLDWRETRGAPLPMTSVTLPTAAELWAVHGDGFVTRSGCVDGEGCTLSWHDDAGAVTGERTRMVNVNVTSVSHDGRRALLVAADEVGPCDDGGLQSTVVRGTLQLLDLATSAASMQLALRTNLWSSNAFTPGNEWFFSAPIAGDACVAQRFELRSTASPFALSPGLGDDLAFADTIDARRWFAFRGEALGVIDPAVADSFDLLGDDSADLFEAAGGWIHAYLGFSNLAQEVVSVGPSGERRTTELRDEDWFPIRAWGRWVRVCRFTHLEGFRDCRVVDVLGEAAPTNFRVTNAPDHPDDTVLLGRDGAVVFVGPLDDGSTRAVQRIDLATGRREQLHAGDGELRPLGDGAAAILVQGTNAWLIEADHEELFADNMSNLFTVPQTLPFPFTGPPRLRQDDIAVLATSSDGGELTLRVLDLRTRRLATLTDRLYLAPHQGFPFVFGDCGQPSPMRLGGDPLDGLLQESRHLFFVEQPAAAGDPAAIWILPIDLSAPPRRLALLEGEPTLCHAPLTSPDGDRIVLGEDGSDGNTTRIVIATP